MIIKTREEAKQELEKNVTLANKMEMYVVTIFRKDLITEEVYSIRMFSDDLAELYNWTTIRENNAISLGIPCYAYLGKGLQFKTGDFNFKD